MSFQITITKRQIKLKWHKLHIKLTEKKLINWPTCSPVSTVISSPAATDAVGSLSTSVGCSTPSSGNPSALIPAPHRVTTVMSLLGPKGMPKLRNTCSLTSKSVPTSMLWKFSYCGYCLCSKAGQVIWGKSLIFFKSLGIITYKPFHGILPKASRIAG